MLLCFSFVTFAICEGLDGRLLHVTHPHRRCAALGLCGVCIKHQDVPCGLQRTFYLLIPALIAVSLMLPLADWQDNAYNTWVFGQLYNYAHLRVYQQFENWYCGAAAIGLLTISLAILAVRGHSGMIWAKITLAGGVGALGFGMFRMILGGAYDQHRVWYLVWEESTEFLFILGILGVLMIFRRGLAIAWPYVSHAC